MSLSDRIRPNCEAAPWVCEEVKKLESHLAIMKINWEHQRDRAAKAEGEVERLSKDLRHIWALFPEMPGKTIGQAHEYQVIELRKRAERAEAELARLKEAAITACRNAQMRVLVWYPENTRSYIHPNELGEIYESQTTECVAAVERAMVELDKEEGAK